MASNSTKRLLRLTPQPQLDRAAGKPWPVTKPEAFPQARQIGAFSLSSIACSKFSNAMRPPLSCARTRRHWLPAALELSNATGLAPTLQARQIKGRRLASVGRLGLTPEIEAGVDLAVDLGVENVPLDVSVGALYRRMAFASREPVVRRSENCARILRQKISV